MKGKETGREMIHAHTNMFHFYINNLLPLEQFQASTLISPETFLIISLEKFMSSTLSILSSSFKNFIYSKGFFFNALILPYLLKAFDLNDFL